MLLEFEEKYGVPTIVRGVITSGNATEKIEGVYLPYQKLKRK